MRPRELFSIDRRARHLFTVGISLSIAGSLALAAWTLSLASGIAHLVDQEPIAIDLLGLVGFLALRVTAKELSTRILNRSSTILRSSLRSALIAHWIERSRTRSVNISPGTESTLLGSGVDSLNDYLTAFLPARVLAGVIPVIVLLIIGFFDRWTLLILLFAGPMLLLLLAVIGQRTKVLADRRFRELGWLRSFYLDMVRGLPTLDVFNRAEESITTIEEVSDRFGRTTMDVLRTAFQTSLVIEWAATAATALVAVQVSFRLIDGDLTYFTALAVLMLTPEFFAPLRTLAVEYHAGQTGTSFLEQLPDLEPSAPDSGERRLVIDSATHSPIHLGPIRFDSVTYEHPGSDRSSIHEVSFSIMPGETIAIVGPSGTGKTTILELLAGRLQPTAGVITVDDRPLTAYSPSDWLRSITSVPQDPFLFRSTVRNNLEIADPDATDEAIEHALHLALATEFVDALPEGLQTPIGEDGRTLSGGQRQRLAIARALLRDAPLVLLDEFTAHLDPETEAALIESLRPFFNGRTVIMATHRRAPLALADRIISLNADSSVGIQS